MEQSSRRLDANEDTLDHGSIIDAQGNEVQITEQMIQHACQTLAECLPNHHAVAAEKSCG